MDGSTEAKNDSEGEKTTKDSPPARETAAAAPSSDQDAILRDNMVDLAVRFLTNTRVQTSPMEHRRAFLKKKGINMNLSMQAVVMWNVYPPVGLTDAEIDKAVQTAHQQGALTPVSNQSAAVTGQVAPPPLPPRPLAPPPQPRSWSEYAVMAAVVGGIGYAVVYFVRVCPTSYHSYMSTVYTYDHH